ncbi:MAG: hypothetical protein ACI4HO_09020 [Ruminococcus sp.]
MKKNKKFILAILIIVIALALIYSAILQMPKSYLSKKYNLEKNEIKSVYFVPPYFRNESNHSSNIFDFEKVNSKWKIKYRNNNFYVDYIDGKYYDDFQLTQIYNWSVEYLQKNIDSHISKIEIHSESIYCFQTENNSSSELIQENQTCNLLDFILKDYNNDFVVYYSVNDISPYIDDTEAATKIKSDLQDKICKYFNFNRKPIVYIVDDEITENDIYSHKGYFLEYKQIELLKQEKHLI